MNIEQQLIDILIWASIGSYLILFFVNLVTRPAKYTKLLKLAELVYPSYSFSIHDRLNNIPGKSVYSTETGTFIPLLNSEQEKKQVSDYIRKLNNKKMVQLQLKQQNRLHSELLKLSNNTQN